MPEINGQNSEREHSRPEVSASWQYWQKIKLKSSESDSVKVVPSSESPTTDLRELLEETELSNHEIALVAGVSPAYLSAVKRGLIQKVGREKLLVLLMVALNMSMEETNTVLAANGHKQVDEFDAKSLIEASQKKTIRGLQTIRSNLSMTLVFLSIESLPGDTLLVHQKPDPALIPLEYAVALGDADDPIYTRLISHVHRKRIELFNDSLERGENRYNLMCEHCFRQYLRSYKSESGPRKDSIIEHLKNTIVMLKKYDNFRVDLLKSCQRNWFRMKLLPPGSAENNKVVFVGRASHSSGTENDSAAIRLFATDNKKIFRQFQKEADRLISQFISPIEDMPKHLAELVKQEAGVDL
ncbi:MAG: hypothetical protein ACLP3B_07730 [Syntrophobacteraceae bacterium]